MAEPRYVQIGVDRTGAAVCRYECGWGCGLRFYRHRPVAIHMGLVADHKHDCKVLHAEDDKRRAAIRAALKSQR